eukprot:XP_019920062.1 PREDICTED: uncharacterized protein LOC105321329 [Crassostrea gigas]
MIIIIHRRGTPWNSELVMKLQNLYRSNSVTVNIFSRVILPLQTTLSGAFGTEQSAGAHKSYRTKMRLAKKQKQNRPVPQWVRMKTGNTIRYNAKRRHWRRTKLKM